MKEQGSEDLEKSDVVSRKSSPGDDALMPFDPSSPVGKSRGSRRYPHTAADQSPGVQWRSLYINTCFVFGGRTVYTGI